MPAAIGTFRTSLRLLRTRRFGTFWFASLLSSIGTWTQQVAEPWLLLTLGASSFLIGLDSFAMTAPAWILTLFGGVLADRADRRRVIAIFQSIQMLCPIAIVALLVTGAIRPWMIIVLSVVVGVTDGLSMPSFQSIVPSIVSHEEIGSGLALNSTQFNLSRILGPSIAGVLMSGAGALVCFVVSAVSYVPFIGVALWILPRRTPDPARARTRATLSLAGIGPIVRQRHVLGALFTVFTTGVLCAPLVVFSPVLVRDVFHGSAGRFSMAVASFGVGGLAGGAALLAVGPLVDRRRISSGFAMAYGLVLVLAALDPWFWGLPPLFVLAGVAMTVSNTSANTVLQSAASPQLLGQTVSLFMLSMSGGMSVGAVLTGMTVSAFGVQHALLMNGLAAVAIQVGVARMWLRAPIVA
jgi:MFS family permease